MKLHTILLCSLLLPLCAACTSSDADAGAPAASTTEAEVPCLCGTPLGDLEGCGHAACSAGRNNPDNPDCVCGTIEIPAEKE